LPKLFNKFPNLSDFVLPSAFTLMSERGPGQSFLAVSQPQLPTGLLPLIYWDNFLKYDFSSGISETEADINFFHYHWDTDGERTVMGNWRSKI
jgi:hypothetical protein